MIYDVIRFGTTFCSQREEADQVLEEIVDAVNASGFRTIGVVLSQATRRLRGAGLHVATQTGVKKFRWSQKTQNPVWLGGQAGSAGGGDGDAA